jgi:hypothetical protein
LSETTSSTFLGNSTTLVYYRQTANIDAAETQEWNSGAGFKSISTFYGTYDGSHNSISNMCFPSSSSGMFSSVRNSVIKNIKLLNVVMDIDETATHETVSGYFGVLAGQASDSIILNASASGYCNFNKGIYCGGLVGYASNTAIEYCSANLSINFINTTYFGGLVGILTSNSLLRNSYYNGNISGNWGIYHAGLVGMPQVSSLIEKCYVASSVNFFGTGIPYSIAGSVSSAGEVKNCFWDMESTFVEEAFGSIFAATIVDATGQTTAQMKQASTYTGWDFTNVWAINETINDGYPYLRQQPDPIMPNNVVLTFPTNSAVNVVRNPTLTWQTGTGSLPTQYRVQLSPNSDFSNPIINQIISHPDVEFNINLLLPANTTYYWKITPSNYAGAPVNSTVWSFTTGINFINNGEFTNEAVISSLIGNYPNPFNPDTSIRFFISNDSHVNIDIFNVKGQKVKSLVSDYYEAGEHNVVWNGRNDDDLSISSGFYFYKMTNNNQVEIKKMMMIK